MLIDLLEKAKDWGLPWLGRKDSTDSAIARPSTETKVARSSKSPRRPVQPAGNKKVQRPPGKPDPRKQHRTAGMVAEPEHAASVIADVADDEDLEAAAGFGTVPVEEGQNNALPMRPLAPLPSGPRSEPDEETLSSILTYQGVVLTAPDGPIPLTKEQRTMVAALDNGTLLVNKSAPLHHHIVSVRPLLRRKGHRIRREYLVELDVIRKVYEAAARRTPAAGKRTDSTQMQREFVELVRRAAEINASDIHVTVDRYEATIRVRVDGVMTRMGELPAGHAQDLCAAAFNMADASDASYKVFDYQGARVSEMNSSLPLPEGVQAVRLQFNPLPNGGRYMIARLLYAQATTVGADIDTLGYSPVHIAQIKRMRKKIFGINIISGPTGSGKSTTLQRALSAVMEEKRGQVNVITIEDPPEYVIRGAAQLPVTNAKTDEERGEAFTQAISASLRSDPDLVMIGEVRDRASAALAFSAAMTGHQVWASLHANDAVSILDRFRDQQVEEYKLTDHTLVTGLIGQRLVRCLCPHCKVTHAQARDLGMGDEELDAALVEIAGRNLGDIFFASLKGCAQCRGGYVGRTVVSECILPDQEFMNRIRQGDKGGAVQYWLDHLDGLTMLEHAVQKMLSGQIDPRDVEDRVGVLTDFDLNRRPRVLEMMGSARPVTKRLGVAS